MTISKADRIRAVLHLPDAAIAKRLRCHPAYVRSVRQRTSRNGNPIQRACDRRWREDNRAVDLARQARWRQFGCAA